MQLNNLKLGLKNGTGVTSLNVVGDCNYETNFAHKLFLTNTKASRLRKAFTNNSSANIKLSKSQLPKIGHSGRFLVKLLGPLLKTGLPLIRNVFKQLTESVLLSLELIAAATTTDAGIHNKLLESGVTTLMISNKKTE